METVRMSRFSDKVVLISGGAGAMGTEIGRRLAQEGAIVILGDISVPDPARMAKVFSPLPLPQVVKLDVTSEESWETVIGDIERTHGRLDVLVNNAGVISSHADPFDDVNLDEWRRVFRINVDGTFLGTKTAIRAMKKTGAGAIVNIGSVAGYVGSKDGAAYGASKAAVRNISKQAALSAARMGFGVRVNTVHPAFVWTPLVQEKLIKLHGSEEAALRAVNAAIPLGQIPSAEDVAAAVAFLASEDARMITGADLVIDGGRLIQ